MAITTITFSNILDPTAYTYLNFKTKYVAYVFKEPVGVTLLSINGYSITDANFTLLPASAISVDPLDATRSLLNWSNLNVTWQIPTGVIPYIAKYVFLGNTYYVIFGVITGTGDFDTTIGIGTDVEVLLDPGSTNPVIFTESRLEGYPYRQPCDTVKNYYNTTGIISVSI